MKFTRSILRPLLQKGDVYARTPRGVGKVLMTAKDFALVKYPDGCVQMVRYRDIHEISQGVAA